MNNIYFTNICDSTFKSRYIEGDLMLNIQKEFETTNFNIMLIYSYKKNILKYKLI